MGMIRYECVISKSDGELMVSGEAAAVLQRFYPIEMVRVSGRVIVQCTAQPLTHAYSIWVL